MSDTTPTAPALAAPVVEIAPAVAAQEGRIELDPIIKQVFGEIQAAEAEIAAARLKLAAAQGKMDILGQLQQLSAGKPPAQE